MKDEYAPRTSPYPPGLSWPKIKRRNNVTDFSRRPSRLAHRARSLRQCKAVPTLSRLLPPSPPTRGSGCLQLHPTATAARPWGVPPPSETTAPRGAELRLRHDAEPPRTAHSLRATSRRNHLAYQARSLRQCKAVLTLSRLLPPSPPTRGSGCLQLHPTATAARPWGVPPPSETTAPRGAG